MKENVPQSIRALRAAGFLKIDCLLNQPIPVVCKLAPSEPESESKLRSLERNKRDVASRTRCNDSFREAILADRTGHNMASPVPYSESNSC